MNGLFVRFKFKHEVPVFVEGVGERTASFCTILNEDGDEVSTGVAVRHPNDNPNRRLGRYYSLENAVSTLDRKQRRVVWCDYWQLRGGTGKAYA